MSRVSGLLFLPDSYFRSERLYESKALRSLAGRARHVYELAAGENPYPQDTPATAKNPQGMLGVDLSGPPWGSAVLHPIAWTSGHSERIDTNITHIPELFEGISTTWVTRGPWVFWVRPHAKLPTPSVAPYDRGYLRFVARKRSGVNATLDIRLTTMGLETGEIISEMDATATVTTTEASFDVSTAWFGPLDGRHSACLVSMKQDQTDAVIDVTAMVIRQVAKRSH